MTDAAQRKLASLLKKLRVKHAEQTAPETPLETPEGLDPAVHEVIYSLLLWEASTPQARQALRRVREAVVDFNELRVCVPDEIAEIIGEKHPGSHERALRLRCVLNDIFSREHAVKLTRLADLPKREVRTYLESLDGMPHFAAARVLAVRLGGHAVPVDRRMRDLLVDEGIAEEGVDETTLSGRLERHVRAEDSLVTYQLLQAWSDEKGHAPRRERAEAKPARAAPARNAKAESRKKSQTKAGH